MFKKLLSKIFPDLSKLTDADDEPRKHNDSVYERDSQMFDQLAEEEKQRQEQEREQQRRRRILNDIAE